MKIEKILKKIFKLSEEFKKEADRLIPFELNKRVVVYLTKNNLLKWSDKAEQFNYIPILFQFGKKEIEILNKEFNNE